MSRFYGDLTGSARTPATRQGTARSGLVGHIRGWNVGIRVSIHDDGAGNDVMHVSITSGSNEHGPGSFILTLEDIDGQPAITAIGDRLWEELSDDEV